MKGRAPAGRTSDVADAIDRVLAAEQATRAAIEAEARRAEEHLEGARALRRTRMERTQERVARLHAAVAARVADLERYARASLAGPAAEPTLPDEHIDALIAALAVRLTTLDTGTGTDAP